MDITTMLMLTDLALGLSKMPAKAPVVPKPRVALGMTEKDVIRALGEPYERGYSMYAGTVLCYRGDMCKDSTCQVWMADETGGRAGTRVTAIRGF